MARIVVQNDQDPGIAVILEEVKESTPERVHGWHGACTECGRLTHHWRQDVAIEAAKRHVDGHESSL